MFDLPENWLDILIRLLSAAFLSGIIGLEREIRNKPAGLRTHMLVGLGASAVCVFGYGVVEEVGGQNESVRLDLIRIISGVIGGLGFLGAGAIMQSRGEVHGMTTAAGIWIVGAIGIGCGTGNYFAVGVTTLIATVCLIPIRILEKKLAIRNPSVERKVESGAL